MIERELAKPTSSANEAKAYRGPFAYEIGLITFSRAQARAFDHTPPTFRR